MTPRLNVGDRAIVRSVHLAWNGRTVHVQDVRDIEPIYTATDGTDDADFARHELEYLPPAPSARPWVLVAVLVVAVVVLALAMWGAR